MANLPPEILISILELADEPSIHADVCWVFNQIATPILYRRVYLYRRHKRVLTNDVHLFLRTIIGRPVLGNCVQCLIADPSDRFRHEGYAPSGDLLSFVATAKSRGLSLEIREAINNGSVAAMLFLLLCHLPKLQEFDLRLPWQAHADYIFYQQMLTTLPLPSALQSVHSAKLYPGYSIITWGMIASFFCLPALRSFMCINGIVYDGEASNSNLVPCSSGIEDIRFYFCAIHDQILKALIHSLQSLRIFVYTFSATNGVTFHPQTLGDALRQCALNALEHLEVFYTDYLSTGSLGSLSGFVNLIYVKISFSLLLGPPDGATADSIAYQLTTSLPGSLVSLCLLIDRAWQGIRIFPVMERFVENRHDRLKRLKNVYIHGNIGYRDRQRIKSLCDAEGLEFVPLSMAGL